MNRDEARTALSQALRAVVPDADLESLPGDADLRQEFELDSLDFVELVEQLSSRVGFRIEDDDAPRLRTVDSAVTYLCASQTVR